jgi:hypothetical protein
MYTGRHVHSDSSLPGGQEFRRSMSANVYTCTRWPTSSLHGKLLLRVAPRPGQTR